MPDTRKHRGPHPEDRALFAAGQLPALRSAIGDLNWLLTSGYADRSALKLVGDRYALHARQRLAISRSACAANVGLLRTQRRRAGDDLTGQQLWIDGYNVITSLEAALSGGVILHAQDGCYRDMASMHGSYRKVTETLPAIEILGNLLAQWNLSTCYWLLDQPVSNSGRLKRLLDDCAEKQGWRWRVDLVRDPDAELIRCGQAVASADRRVIDGARCWLNLAREAIDSMVPSARIIDLCVSSRPDKALPPARADHPHTVDRDDQAETR